MKNSESIISVERMSLKKIKIIKQSSGKKALILNKNGKYFKGIVKPKDSQTFILYPTEKENHPEWFLPVFYHELSELIMYNN